MEQEILAIGRAIEGLVSSLYPPRDVGTPPTLKEVAFWITTIEEQTGKLAGLLADTRNRIFASQVRD